MPKPHSSILHSLLTAAILLAGIPVFVQSCRKMDQPVTSQPLSLKKAEAKFFNSNRSADATEKVLVDYFIRRNDSSHFVEKAIERIGYPRWNKALKFTSNSSIQGRAETNGTTTITYIPFVRDDEQRVNALMAVKTTATDTSFRYLCDWQYADTAATHMAADVFSLFLIKMDNRVFGHERYAIKDSAIFDGWATKPAAIRIVDSMPPVTTDLLTPVIYTICFITYGPVYRCGWLEGCTTGDENCFKYCRDELGRACFDGVIYEDDGDWGTGGGGTGSGGGNPGNGGGDPPPDDTPPTCHEASSPGVAGRPLDPCGPGWEPIPVDDDPPPPCDSYITALGNDLNFANYFKSLADTSVINLNYEKGFYVADRVGNNYLAVQGNPNSPVINFYNVTLPTDGILHSHYGGLNPIFSPDDVLMMAKIFLNGLAKDSNNLFFGMTHNYGPPYLLKVTNVAKFRKFAERIVKMQENEKKKERFTDKYNNLLRSDNTTRNEREFLNMLNFEKAGNGLTLYRAENNDCRKWKKLERDSFNQTGVIETPCN